MVLDGGVFFTKRTHSHLGCENTGCCGRKSVFRGRASESKMLSLLIFES